MKPVYTVAVVTPRWFRDKRDVYTVVFHKIDIMGPHLALALHFPEGGMIVIPGLDRKKLIIYDDYQEARYQHQVQKERDALEQAEVLINEE